MSKVIRLEEETFARLQRLAEPLIDSPSSVIGRLLDYYESSQNDVRLDQRKPNLFLAPAIEENIDKTIRNPISLKDIRHSLSKEDAEQLKKKSEGLKELHCWAMTEGSRAVYETMREGDIVLLTLKNTGKFQYVGEVTYKSDNEPLGNLLWDIVPSKPWKLIYFLKNLRTIEVDKARLITELGYKSNYTVPGVVRVNTLNLQIVNNRYESISNLINVLSS